MKRFILAFIFALSVFTVLGDSLKIHLIPDTTACKLKIVYYYTLDNDDTFRFPMLMRNYNSICNLYTLETAPAPMGIYGLERKMEIYDEDQLLGTMWGIPTKNTLQVIYNEYYRLILSVR